MSISTVKRILLVACSGLVIASVFYLFPFTKVWLIDFCLRLQVDVQEHFLEMISLMEVNYNSTIQDLDTDLSSWHNIHVLVFGTLSLCTLILTLTLYTISIPFMYTYSMIGNRSASVDEALRGVIVLCVIAVISFIFEDQNIRHQPPPPPPPPNDDDNGFVIEGLVSQPWCSAVHPRL